MGDHDPVAMQVISLCGSKWALTDHGHSGFFSVGMPILLPLKYNIQGLCCFLDPIIFVLNSSVTF